MTALCTVQRKDTTSVPIHSRGNPWQMDSLSRCIAEMALGSEHGPQHCDSFSWSTIIHRRRNKWPTTMSKYNSTLGHHSHQLVVYNFRFRSYIPRTYTTNVFHSHREKQDSNGPANLSQKSGKLSTDNGSTALNSSMRENYWTITPRNWLSTPKS